MLISSQDSHREKIGVHNCITEALASKGEMWPIYLCESTSDEAFDGGAIMSPKDPGTADFLAKLASKVQTPLGLTSLFLSLPTTPKNGVWPERGSAQATHHSFPSGEELTAAQWNF